MNNSEPFIAIDFWIKYADIVIEHQNKHLEYENKINELAQSLSCITIFLKTDLLPNYMELIFSIESPYILITASNDDHCPPYIEYPPRDDFHELTIKAFIEKPELIFWFAKNPCITHPKICAYPLGPKWQWKTTRFFGEDKTKHLTIYNELCRTPKLSMLNQKSKPNLLYFNFNQTSNNPLYQPHKNIRHTIKNELSKRFTWNKSEEFAKYMETLSTYKFCVSPPGRGIDTHRCWEALMMGTIPLLVSTPFNYLFNTLPVIIVKDWQTITPEYLEREYETILKNIEQYDFSILYTNYWVEILSSKKKDQEVGCPPL
tara:strand:+ start:331 stop:1278 length:948 start_codon:yes stop_codon:yes gene_type:complete